MAGDDSAAEFRELLLLQHAPRWSLPLVGALAAAPEAGVLAVAASLLLRLPAPETGSIALAFVIVAGALAAFAYRRGQVPYRRGDLAAAAVFMLSLAPIVVLLAGRLGATLAPGLALVVSILPALALELGWRPVFLAALRRLAGLHLDTLAHEALREHYGDDWQAYTERIRADLREARRLREEGAKDEHER